MNIIINQELKHKEKARGQKHKNNNTQSKCTEHPTLQANVYLEPVGLSFHTDALRFIHVCPVGVRDGDTRVGQFARLTKQKQTKQTKQTKAKQTKAKRNNY